MRKPDKSVRVLLLSTLFLFINGYLQGIVVNNVSELVAAVNQANLGGDKNILLADGTYILNDMLLITANDITIRSLSGKRKTVTIKGKGMYGGVSHIFNVSGSRFTARDMTLGWVANHAIQIRGEQNADDPLLSNLHITDTYEQMIKISYQHSDPASSDNGILENSLLEYSAGIGPQYYIGGIDGHQAKGWTVRHNIFKDISSPAGDIAEHAVHFWSDSEGTLVEGNVIIDCDRGIGFGLGDRGHSGGVIRNNMIVHTKDGNPFADVGIGLENASIVQVYNNSVYFTHSYPNAIEFRFPGTTGGSIENNLCNRNITQRDGGSASVYGNITDAQSYWFIGVAAGNLHLRYPVTEVVDKGKPVSELGEDIDGDHRPIGKEIDIGADEYCHFCRFPILHRCDYSGYGKSDISVWRPDNGVWYIKDAGTIHWGMKHDIPVSGDYDDNGQSDIAVWRPSNGRWYIKDTGSFVWGMEGDIPVPGDYDGDGQTDISVWRPSNGKWFIKNIGILQWGTNGDMPAPEDYDGDGISEFAVFRPSSGKWYLKGILACQWGTEGDIPVPGDYDGDGQAELAVWRPSNGRWYIKDIGNYAWGQAGDIPVPGDYNGDVTVDIAVWRPSNGRWIIKDQGSYSWGMTGDLPLVR
jgi:hypothetical protein